MGNLDTVVAKKKDMSEKRGSEEFVGNKKLKTPGDSVSDQRRRMECVCGRRVEDRRCRKELKVSEDDVITEDTGKRRI